MSTHTYTYQSDFQAIVDLTIKYCWTIDTHEFETLREIFLPDATALLGDERNGIDSIITRIHDALTPLDASQHIVANHQVTVDGDRATARCYFQAQHVRRSAQGSPNYIVAGRYQDQLVRTTDGWRIERRVLHVDWTDGNVKVVRP
jgi:SnoaL-like domain